jgi:hypothetical protein
VSNSCYNKILLRGTVFPLTSLLTKLGFIAPLAGLDEGAKVGLVLDKFAPTPVKAAQDNTIQLLVGRVVIAGQAPFYAPGSGKPCVYFNLVVEEEHHIVDHVEVDDGQGNKRMERRERDEWRVILKEEQYVDFYLQDGIFKVFVNGSNRGQCKVQSQKNTGHASIFSRPPPGACMGETYSSSARIYFSI